MLHWMAIIGSNQGWTEELAWATRNRNGHKLEDQVYRMTMAAVVYFVWKESNHRLFRKKAGALNKSVDNVFKKFTIEVVLVLKWVVT